jgi:hypothetical protein
MKNVLLRKTSTRHWVGLVLFALALFTYNDSSASHYRHGTISWRVVSGNTIQFKISQAWANWGNWTVGQTGYSDRLYFGDGTYYDFSVVATAVNGTGGTGWYYGETTFNKTYTNTGNYTAYFSSCCKISNLSNNANASWRNETVVNVGSGNSSPVTTMAPIINMQTGMAAATFQVPASDPDNNTLTYRLATYSEISGNQPAGFSIHPTTGVITFNTVGKAVGSLWNAAIVVEDGNTKVINDFIIQIVQQSNPPAFDYSVTPTNGNVYQVSPGTNVSFTVKAVDTDPGSTVTLQGIGLPPGASLSPALPTTGSGQAQTSFSWTPGTGNLGTNVINFLAQDNVGAQVSTSVTIQVSLKPKFDVPPTPAAGVHNVYTPGTTISYTVRASDPDVNDSVSIISATGKNSGGAIPLYSGASFSPLPTAWGNPTSGTFSWATQASDWGHRHVIFTAKDGYNETTTHEISMLLNTLPYVSSTAPTSVIAGATYTYNITAVDPDITYGDEVDFVPMATLPSWLTLTTNPATGTAVLTGTPSVSDAGTYNITLMVEDKAHHHYTTIPSHSFSITVVPCNISVSGTSTNATCPSSADGSVQLTITGGTAPFTTSPSTTNLAPGTYNYTVTDANNCVATTTVVVSGVDNVLPTISCPFNITVNAPANSCGAVVNYNVPSASDNCGTGSLPTSLPGFTYKGTFGGHTYFLSNSMALPEAAHATAVSLGGYLTTINSAAENAFISGMFSGYMWIGLTDRDVEGQWKWITGEPVTYTTWAPGEPNNYLGNEDWAVINWGSSNWNDWFYTSSAYYVVEFSGGTIPATLVSGLATGATFPIGTTSVTYQATDASNNSASCTFTVTVNDVTPPTVVTQNISVPLDASGNVSITANDVNNGSYDACGIASMSVSPSSFTCANVGVNTVTLTVVDSNNKVSSSTATVTVVDNVAPVAAAQNVTVYLDATGNGATTTAAVDNGSNDICGIASLALSQTAFNCAHVGANTVTLTVTDNNSNVSTTTATVTVVDNVAPVAAAQNVTVYLDATGNGATTAAAVDNGSNDACGIASLALSQTAFNCAHVGANTVTLTVTDNNSNVSTTTATVTVVDNVAPVAIAKNITVNLTSNGTVSIVGTDVDNGSNDACGIASYSVSPASFTCAHRGANAVVLTVTDNNGNVSTANATVTIVGNASFTVGTSVTNVSCYQGSDGAVDLSVSGGIGPYTYAWSNAATSEDISGLTAGSYSVTILDVNTCDAYASATVTEPTLLVASIATLPNSSLNTTNWGTGANIVLGYGNGPTTATLNGSATGGTTGYTYKWTPATGLSNANIANPVFTPSNSNQGCHIYYYQLEVTDANGCIAYASIDIKVVNADCSPNANNHKVQMTKHNNKNRPVVICVSVNAVPAQLANGATFGNSSSCGSTTYSEEIGEAFAEDMETGLGLVLFPNPNSGLITFEMVNFDMDYPADVEILDHMGRRIATEQIGVDSKHQIVQFDLNARTSVSSGFYIARIVNGENVVIRKFEVLK